MPRATRDGRIRGFPPAFPGAGRCLDLSFLELTSMPPFTPDPTKIKTFRTAAALARWLRRNHGRETELWLRVYKKDSGVPTITIAEALDEALCWGWIDGIRKALDEQSFLQRYSPRRPRSVWSQINRDHVARLTAAGRMTPYGQRQIDAAKADGRWDAAYAPLRSATVETMPDDLRAAIEASPLARKTFRHARTSEPVRSGLSYQPDENRRWPREEDRRAGGDAGAWRDDRALAARGASLAAFDGRWIPAGGVAPRSHTPGMLGRRALPAARLARLGADARLHHRAAAPSLTSLHPPEIGRRRKADSDPEGIGWTTAARAGGHRTCTPLRTEIPASDTAVMPTMISR